MSTIFDRVALVLISAINFADAFDWLGIAWLQIQDADLRKALCAIVWTVFAVALSILRRLDELLEGRS